MGMKREEEGEEGERRVRGERGGGGERARKKLTDKQGILGLCRVM